MSDTVKNLDDTLADIYSRLDEADDLIKFPQSEGASASILQRAKNVEDWDGDNQAPKA